MAKLQQNANTAGVQSTRTKQAHFQFDGWIDGKI